MVLMNLPRLMIAVSCGLLLAGCNMTMVDSIPPLPADVHAPVVAVSSFENRAGGNGQWKLGDGMADLLVSELVASRNFVVVEREHFSNITLEIDRQQNGLFRPEGRTEKGHMKNARYLVRGVINDFSQTGGGSFSVSFFRRLFFLGRAYTARVALTLTLVDVETGEILSAVQSTGLVRTSEAYARANYEGISFGGDVFFETPLGKATARAIYGGVKQISREIPKDPWRPMISCLRSGTLFINGGKDRGFRTDVKYVVRGPAEPVTDPATGDIITYVPGPKIGVVQIFQVDGKLAYAKPVEGHDFARGQWLMKADLHDRGP